MLKCPPANTFILWVWCNIFIINISLYNLYLYARSKVGSFDRLYVTNKGAWFGIDFGNGVELMAVAPAGTV